MVRTFRSNILPPSSGRITVFEVCLVGRGPLSAMVGTGRPSEFVSTLNRLHGTEFSCSRSGSQEFPSVLLNPKDNYRVHKSQPPFPVFSQMNHRTITKCFLKVHLNITLSSAPGSPNFPSIQVFLRECCKHFSSPPCMPHTLPIISFRHPTRLLTYLFRSSVLQVLVVHSHHSVPNFT